MNKKFLTRCLALLVVAWVAFYNIPIATLAAGIHNNIAENQASQGIVPAEQTWSPDLSDYSGAYWNSHITVRLQRPLIVGGNIVPGFWEYVEEFGTDGIQAFFRVDDPLQRTPQLVPAGPHPEYGWERYHPVLEIPLDMLEAGYRLVFRTHHYAVHAMDPNPANWVTGVEWILTVEFDDCEECD